jgi:YfiH family protein
MTAPEEEVWLDGLRVFRQPAWADRIPGLAQGITGRATDLDFSFPDRPWESGGVSPQTSTASHAWRRLLTATGMAAAVRCRQVHGNDLVIQDGELAAGVHVAGEADALITGRSGVLLAVSVADCVPVYVVDPESRLIGLAHAGWRGAAAGVVDATLQALRDRGSDLGSLYVHLGPAICGKCYEVGPEVIAALGDSADEPRHVDLRRHIAEAAVAAGVDRRRLTISDHCTRCESDAFFSYRGGDRGGRMCAYLGWPSS